MVGAGTPGRRLWGGMDKKERKSETLCPTKVHYDSILTSMMTPQSTWPLMLLRHMPYAGGSGNANTWPA